MSTVPGAGALRRLGSEGALADRLTDRPTARPPSRPVLVVLPPVTRPEARVYRRRRLAVLFAALSVLALPALLVATAGSAPTTTPAASSPDGTPVRAVYVVQPGDTLWSIAHEVDPSADPREVVDRLVELNGGAALQPGQRLRLTDN